MKVMLIQPPFTILRQESKKCHPPLGLAYLAACVKNAGFDVYILDALAEGYENTERVDKNFIRYGLSFDEIREKVASVKPDVVGVSCLFSAQAENVHRICRVIKEAVPGIVTVIGGAHPTSAREESLSDNNVDFIVIGEGESIFAELLRRLECGMSYRDIAGLGYKENGFIKINERVNYENNLDFLPFPLWEAFPLHRYHRINNPHGSPAKRVPYLPVVTSRGCPFECVFCSIRSLWGPEYRKRSAGNVLNELKYLRSKFGVKEIFFEDDNLIVDKNRAEDIFRGIIDDGLDLLWSTPNGVTIDSLNNELLSLMKKSGCYSISMGIESGDPVVLKDMVKKPVDIFKAVCLIKKARKLGIETSVFFVVGFPGEGVTEIKKTFDAARRLGADYTNFFFATPLPGTRLLELCRQRGLVGKQLDYNRLKSNMPYFDNGLVTMHELFSLVRREKIKLYFLYLLKHPLKFFNRLAKRYA